MSDSNTLSLVTQQNALALGAIGDLVASVVCEIAGNEISNSVNGQTLNSDLARILVNQEIVNALTA